MSELENKYVDAKLSKGSNSETSLNSEEEIFQVEDENYKLNRFFKAENYTLTSSTPVGNSSEYRSDRM